MRLQVKENRKLSPDEIKELVADYQNGSSLRSLVQRFGMHEQTVRAHLKRQGVRNGKQAAARVRELLDRVGLPADAGRRTAREFSGGQRQRIAIARALALRPRLIICDEPTSALDLSTQIRVLDLLLEIQETTGCAYLFISHDLAVVRRMSHRIAVLLRGEIVEEGDARQVSDDPRHPYTQRLHMAAPVADPVRQQQRRLARRKLLADDALTPPVA